MIEAPAWVVFVLSGSIVVLAGIRLARDGDAIAERTGLGSAWVGAVLVAGATSLPEFLTNAFAVRQGHAGLAIGGLLGANMANMLILAVADLALRNQRILRRVAVDLNLVGQLAIALTAIAAAGILTDGEFSTFGLGWAPLVAAGSYLGGMRLLHANRPKPLRAEDVEAAVRAGLFSSPRRDLLRPGLGFGAATLALLVAAPSLAESSVAVADQLGVSTGVVGVALLAVVTTLPEVSVTVASLRARSYDLAVGNLLGSSCFNMALLLPLDLLDGGGPLLSSAGPSALVAALFAIVLISQTLVEVLNVAEQRVWWIEPDAALRIATYAFGIAFVIRVG